ncbi:prolyl endopeptidase [Phymastichus coffea]|uniref:prolyl endopeptidase n=1 Tax=Phymastichus coffea TaxID=108790 RepID=UPI00273ACF6B|nr:prolyl endopeptidase [Phymastichus coffea]
MFNHLSGFRITLKKFSTRPLAIHCNKIALELGKLERFCAPGTFLTSRFTALPQLCRCQCYYSTNKLSSIKSVIDDKSNCYSMPSMTKFNYPKARRDETAVDVYHGVEVPDPYKWLEDPDAEETKAYVDAQNAISLPFIHACPKRQAIHNRLKQLWDFPKYSCPSREGDKYYFFMNTGLQNQSVLYVQNSLDGEPKVFLDPNTFSDDGTVAISDGQFSEDGSIYAYGLSSSGSDWKKIHFINAKTGKKYPEVLEKVKFSSISWTHDNKGVFYALYPDHAEKSDGSETVLNKNQKVYYHKVGSPQTEDVLVVEFPEHPQWRISAEVTDCGRWLIVSPQLECQDNMVFFTKLNPNEEIKGKLKLTEVIGTLEADYDYVANFGTRAIFRTNKNAPNYKLISIDLENFEKGNWSELIAEHPRNVLNWACAVDGDKLVVCYLEDVKSILGVYSLETGKLLKQLPLDVGTIVGFSGDKKYSEIFYKFTSFLTPGIIYTVDLKKEELPKVFREIKVNDFDASLYKTAQIFYPSKDGTKIPMFIITKKDVVLDGSSPCLLYGYGGFNVSIQPAFSVTRLVFLQHLNGIVAIPNIRGGGEYGEKWHNGGRFSNKQNVFDDFQCAAEYLIENRYTSAKKIIIQGGSNGGLLVAACLNQRPDLFGAAIAQVGVMDMLKFHKFTIGYCWTSDYGSADDPEHFKALIKYSPLHNVKPPKDGGQYPATLLLTADHDDRVVPLHSLKLIATLQHEIGQLPQQTNPLLIRLDVKAGHGVGKPTSKEIEEYTDILAFIVQTLNLDFKEV